MYWHSHGIQLRKLAYAIKNSTTILLPRWVQLLEDLAKDANLSNANPLTVRMMPRDVATRWNSTYDMLVFALDYHQAIDEITADRDMRKYKLSEDEWALVQQLGDVLAMHCASYHSLPSTHIFADIQGRNSVLFTFYAQPRHRDTHNGSH